MDLKLVKRILKESLRVLILASIVSSIGGIGFEAMKLKLVFLMPLLIMLPALNDMIGDFGIIVASKFSTLVRKKKISGTWWRSHALGEQFRIISSIALFAAFYLSVASLAIAHYRGALIDSIEALKIIAIGFMLVAVLVITIFVIAVVGGLWVYKRGGDTNTFLIPLTTSVADLASLLLFAVLVGFLF